MAKSTRVSKKVVSGITQEQFTTAMGKYALADASCGKITAKMDAEITKIRDKYTDDINDLIDIKDSCFEIIEVYCKENKQTLFSEARSFETMHGKVGFRLGMPKLKTLPKFTWDRVLERLEAVMPDFVRVKKEVAKDEILMHRDDASVAPHLKDVGVYVDQEESFYIELKKETTD